MGQKVFAAAIAALALGASAAPASADQAILGVATPTTVGGGISCSTSCTIVQTALPVGEIVTPPATGRIVAWWALGDTHGSDATSARLRLTHVSPATHKTAGVGTSSPQLLQQSVVNFQTALPTRSGDHLGLTLASPDFTDVQVGVDSAATAQFFDALPDGTSEFPMNSSHEFLNMGAQFFYQPAITGVAATSGANTGGESVVITGDHLTDTTAVRFGSTAAPSFHIDSNTQITATAPAESPGTVDVTAAGPGGQSATSSADKYTYLAPGGGVSPPNLDFGSRPLQSTSTEQPVTLSNTGTISISVNSATLTGPDAADYTKTFDSCSAKSVAPGRSCEVDVTFTPTVAGPRRATLEFDDSLEGSPQDVALTGTGAAPGGPGPGGAPSNFFSLGKLSGTTLPVIVASLGTVRVTAVRSKSLLSPSTARGGPGKLHVKLKLTPTAKKKLRLGRRLRLRVRVTFTPDGGTAASKVVTLTVKPKRRKH